MEGKTDKKESWKWILKKSVLSFVLPKIDRIKRLSSSKPVKVALCCIAKCENDYIREFVEHYKSIGFDNITIFDNNDPDGESFLDVIPDHIESGFCRIIDYRGRKLCQLDAYRDFYESCGNEYDWIAYFDCDEFLVLKHHSDIQSFLEDKRYSRFQEIHVNWLSFGDCEQLDNDGRPLFERFDKPIYPFQELVGEPYYRNNHIKSIVRSGLYDVRFFHVHNVFIPFYKCCDVRGNECESQSYWAPYDYETAWLNHYSTKTIGEWVRIKMKRGYPDQSYEDAQKNLGLDKFYDQNKRSIQKDEYAENLLRDMTTL